MAQHLLIPPSAQEPKSRCFICGTEFPLRQSLGFAAHLRKCAKANEGLFEEMQHERASSVFTSPEDPELYDHIRAGGN